MTCRRALQRKVLQGDTRGRAIETGAENEDHRRARPAWPSAAAQHVHLSAWGISRSCWYSRESRGGPDHALARCPVRLQVAILLFLCCPGALYQAGFEPGSPIAQTVGSALAGTLVVFAGTCRPMRSDAGQMETAGRQSEGVLPSPNSLSTASTPPAPQKPGSVTHVSGTMCHPSLRPHSQSLTG
jgi:hypothetical protein